MNTPKTATKRKTTLKNNPLFKQRQKSIIKPRHAPEIAVKEILNMVTNQSVDSFEHIEQRAPQIADFFVNYEMYKGIHDRMLQRLKINSSKDSKHDESEGVSYDELEYIYTGHTNLKPEL